MKTAIYRWQLGDGTYTCEWVRVPGTHGDPYLFGEGDACRRMEVGDFWMAATAMTQALYEHLTGANPAIDRAPRRPVENVSWDDLHRPGGLLERIHASELPAQLAQQANLLATVFRLPSEAEWEYAARGGPYWPAGYCFSGSNAIENVAWYDRRHGDHTQEVALKAPNQLGLYDMSGNVWEWCEDAYTSDVSELPADGRPYRGASSERVLRGGCFHNWAVHCTVSKRYQIDRQFHDGCIGFRLVFAGH